MGQGFDKIDRQDHTFIRDQTRQNPLTTAIPLPFLTAYGYEFIQRQVKLRIQTKSFGLLNTRLVEM